MVKLTSYGSGRAGEARLARTSGKSQKQLTPHTNKPNQSGDVAQTIMSPVERLSLI